MSKETTNICNQCGDVCVAGHSGIEFTYGELLNHFEDAVLDLCQDCSAGLLDCVKQGPSWPSDRLGSDVGALGWRIGKSGRGEARERRIGASIRIALAYKANVEG
jgi:hypothetical protein